MLDKAQEDMIQSICFGLKKIKNKSKVLIVLQLITDVYLFSSLLMELISSFYALPFITLIVIIVKAVLTSMKRDTVSCAICSALNLSAFAMAFTFKIIDYNTAAAFIIAFMIYGLRIKQCVIEKKINSLYGYPTFHAFFIINELKKDESLSNEVIAEYSLIDNDPLLKSEMKRIRMSPLINVIRLLGVVGIVAGIIIMCNGLNTSVKINSAGAINTVSSSPNGTYFCGSTNKICGMSNTGMDKNAEDIYWCIIGDECVTIKVPLQYKEIFAKFYNRTEENDSSSYDEYSNEKVEFRGIVCDASKYDASIINTKTLKSEEDSLIITDKFIEVISPDIIEKNMNLGFTITLIGMAAYMITIVLRATSDKVYAALP